jgi:LDH2 family malate/lactate/ureidoglycolate dehydrogenase
MNQCRYYAELIGSQGLIGMVLAQSPEFVAPHGAKQAIFGTNPIAISVPADAAGNGSSSSSGGGDLGRRCVTMDMATSAYAWFGLLEAKTAGRPIPEGVGLDANGHPTTDPNQASGCLACVCVCVQRLILHLLPCVVHFTCTFYNKRCQVPQVGVGVRP